MALFTFDGHFPLVADSAFIEQSARVYGAVSIADESSLWPYTVVRGDVQKITIGKRSNIQDGTVIHVTHDSDYCPGGLATIIGDEVTVGHQATLHACTIEDRCLIGMGSIIMDGAIIQSQTIIAAGSLVSPGKTLIGGYLYQGRPVRRVRPLNEREIAFLSYSAENYVRLKARYQKNPPHHG